MEKIVVLTPVKARRNIWFKAVINQANGGQTVITSDYRIKRKDELQTNEKPLEVRFDKGVTTAFIIKWDSQYEKGPKTDGNGKTVGEMDYRKFMAANELCTHHQTKPLYGIKNPNLFGEPLFVLEDLTVRNQYGVSKTINQWKVVSKLVKMNFHELTDCAYYYGYSGTSKNRSDLFLYLGDFKLGVLHNDVILGNNNLSQMEDFLERYNPQANEVTIKVVSEKALVKAGLFNKLENGYYYNGEYIGTRKEHLVDYLKQRPDVFNFIRSQVEEDSLGEDDIKQIMEKAYNEDRKAMPDAELLNKETESEEKMVRAQAKLKLIRSFGTTGVEKLKSMFPECDRVIKEAQNRGISLEGKWQSDLVYEIEEYDRKLKKTLQTAPVE